MLAQPRLLPTPTLLACAAARLNQANWIAYRSSVQQGAQADLAPQHAAHANLAASCPQLRLRVASLDFYSVFIIGQVRICLATALDARS